VTYTNQPPPDRPDGIVPAADQLPVARIVRPIEVDEDVLQREEGPTSSERSLALWCHLGGFFTFVIIPLIIWMTNRDKSRFVDEHGKEAINFQITLTIYYVVGCLIFPVIGIFETVVVIKAALAARRGEPYRCPLNIRFIK
jgi:uncharacterized Tic20 family protein